MLQDYILCWITTWLLTWSFAGALEARFTCREEATLYLDGEYSLTFNWTHWMVLPDDVLEVAIFCHSDRIKGGLIVSMSNGIVSDSNWKCFQKGPKNWYNNDFDDSQWPAAHVFNEDDHELAQTIAGVDYPANAKWIWREGGPTTEKIRSAFCRRRIGTVKAHVRCDDQGEVYVDGKFVGSTSKWTEVWKSSLTEDATVFAVKCRNNLDSFGLLASFSNGIVSNRHWKCAYSEIGCSQIDFDDSEWNYAETIKRARFESDRTGGFPPQADWIWVAGGSGDAELKEICCRILLKSPELYIESNRHRDATASIVITLCCLLAVATAGCIAFATLYFINRKKGNPRAQQQRNNPRRRKAWHKLSQICNPSDSDDTEDSQLGLLNINESFDDITSEDYALSDHSAYTSIRTSLDPSMTIPFNADAVSEYQC